jgi:hypothetical protein
VGVATTMLFSGGLGLAGLGPAMGTAQAEPGFAPRYHWCPGDDWRPEWGFNWDWGNCHDDHHRDRDAGDHRNDWNDWGGPGPADWQPLPPPPPPDLPWIPQPWGWQP